MAKLEDSKIVGSPFWNRSLKRAGRLLKKPKKLNSFLGLVSLKLAKKLQHPKGLKGIQDEVKLAFELLKAYAKGSYREINYQSILYVTAAFVYFLIPTDFIPDFIIGFGLLDDVTVFSWMIANVRKETQQFAHWKGLRTT